MYRVASFGRTICFCSTGQYLIWENALWQQFFRKFTCFFTSPGACLSWFSCKRLRFSFAFSLISKCYSAHAAYCNSKLAQLLFSSHLHQELQHGGFPVSSCAVDPGMVDTALYRHLWMPLRLMQSTIARLLFKVTHYSDFDLLYSHVSEYDLLLYQSCCLRALLSWKGTAAAQWPETTN